jgi:PAS domain S-box-containing protein
MLASIIVLIITVRRQSRLELKYDRLQSTHKTSETELEKLLMIARETVNSIIIADKNGIIEWVNESFTRNTGYSLEDIRGTSGETLRKNMKTPLGDPKFFENFKKSKEVIKYETLNFKKNGTPIWVLTHITPIFDENGELKKLIAIDSDITERKKTEDELKLAKEYAEKSEKIKEEFLMNMSHEIRTPMNAVIGMSNLLLHTNPSEKQKKYINAIRTAGDNLLNIINDILDFSKIEAGKMDIVNDDFNIRQLIQNVIETVRFKTDEKGLELLTDIAPNVPEILVGDPYRLNQILMNLVGNAIKFTQQGSITIKAEIVELFDDEIKLCFEVKDTGIGIPEDKLNVIFDSFTQASSDTTRKYGGTGLGLTIVKKLAKLMYGYVDVESTIGKGSNFKVFLPYSTNPEKIKQIKKHNIKVEIPENIDFIDILIAEDNEFNQIVAKESLENFSSKFRIDIASNGKIAIEKLNKKNYDLILMDIQMPEIDGFEATKNIRKRTDDKKNIPIVAMTAHAMTQDIEKSFKVGMDDYISKPFKTNVLVDKILKQLKIKKVFENAEFEQKVEDKEHKKNEIENTNFKIIKNETVSDLTYLKQFSNGDEERVLKYINIYLKTAPTELLNMLNGLQTEQFDNIYRAAHSLKPQMTYMGIKSMENLIREIEQNAKNHENIDQLHTLIKNAETILNKSFEELSQYK